MNGEKWDITILRSLLNQDVLGLLIQDVVNNHIESPELLGAKIAYQICSKYRVGITDDDMELVYRRQRNELCTQLGIDPNKVDELLDMTNTQVDRTLWEEAAVNFLEALAFDVVINSTRTNTEIEDNLYYLYDGMVPDDTTRQWQWIGRNAYWMPDQLGEDDILPAPEAFIADITSNIAYGLWNLYKEAHPDDPV